MFRSLFSKSIIGDRELRTLVFWRLKFSKYQNFCFFNVWYKRYTSILIHLLSFTARSEPSFPIKVSCTAYYRLYSVIIDITMRRRFSDETFVNCFVKVSDSCCDGKEVSLVWPVPGGQFFVFTFCYAHCYVPLISANSCSIKSSHIFPDS